ncbi:FACT complex subunit [Caenorhabditis elegans]|uniref:FACT complex subunit n=1 Tax=Caenorhabditis elegans TaxID=6239 RepID=Q9U2I5_CAEEL|nr:FACT complex subunit [Caenorhabditis elegans]CAB63356.2 FACT complex subunit [Caenorhabditis elegans]|eukprot:NP_499513.2 Uncharacterized protein CELE_Y41C4A.7 [Caenorhabditis elegans]
MEDFNRRAEELDQVEKNVSLGLKKIQDEMDSIQLEVEPDDVEITSTKRGFWEHDITNLSPFPVVCRVRATSPSMFVVNKNVFLLKPMDFFKLMISRKPGQIRSHHLKIDVTQFVDTFNPINLLDYFIASNPFKTFVVRYHGAPRYWSDALEMNSWLTGEQLNEQWEKEMKKTSQEKKSSLETSEVSSVNEFVDAEEDNFPVQRAAMNITNVLTVASQVPDESNKNEPDSDIDSVVSGTIDSELANLKI